MNDLSHPSTLLNDAYTSQLRNEAPLAEKSGKFTRNQLQLVQTGEWMKILTPTEYGGAETSLPQALELLEGLAWADGSTGWMTTLCALAGWRTGFADPEVAKKTLADANAFLADGGTETGTAEKTAKGYKVTGEWPHACGSADATAFIANCTVVDQGKTVKNEKNKDEILSFLFLKNEVTILPAWNVIGLVATSGNGFKVANLEVPENRAFKTAAQSSKTGSALYNYPLLQLGEAALAVNISGMAIHFTDLCQTLFNEKKTSMENFVTDEPGVQETFDKYTQRLNDARTKLHYAVALSWQACMNSKQIKEAILYKVSSGAHDLAKKARECVDALYPFCGLAAADKDCEINRVWRDLHTGSQHRLLVFGGSPE